MDDKFTEAELATIDRAARYTGRGLARRLGCVLSTTLALIALGLAVLLSTLVYDIIQMLSARPPAWW